MSHVVTPALEAAVMAAPRTECALNMEVSIPAFSSILLSHWAMVELEATLCGLMVMRKRGFDPSSFLNSSVLPSYAHSVITGHNNGFAVKAGKKNSATGLDCPDCFANLVGWKEAPSVRYFLNLRSRWERSADLDGLVSARSITVLWVRSVSDRASFSPLQLMYNVTFDTSHISEYLGWDGLSWKIPFRSLDTIGCWPTSYPSTYLLMHGWDSGVVGVNWPVLVTLLIQVGKETPGSPAGTQLLSHVLWGETWSLPWPGYRLCRWSDIGLSPAGLPQPAVWCW